MIPESNDPALNTFEIEALYYKNQLDELARSVLKFQYLNAELNHESAQMKRGLSLVSDLKLFDTRHLTLNDVYLHFCENILVRMLMDYVMVIETDEFDLGKIICSIGYKSGTISDLSLADIVFSDIYLNNPESLLINSETTIPESIASVKNQLDLDYFMISPVINDEKAIAFIIAGRRTEKKYLASGKLRPHDLNLLEAVSGIISAIKYQMDQTIILENKVEERTFELNEEKKKSDTLLLNILPEEIANELKIKGYSPARQFEHVTVMFTDFKGFTSISEKLSASELVEEIDTCFKAFDHIISKHNIEKIKTIGDSYMCASGLPIADLKHAVNIIDAALEIQDFMIHYNEEKSRSDHETFEIRIGINSGPLIAGIVGYKKFAYDIWGDTVNMASRMESSGEEGKINISGNTYELIKDHYICKYRGKISAKNKGELDMYFVENRLND